MKEVIILDTWTKQIKQSMVIVTKVALTEFHTNALHGQWCMEI